MVKKRKWFVVFLLFFAVGCFLSAAYAGEEEKKKEARGEKAPAKAGQQMKRGEEHRAAEHREAHRADFHHFVGRDYHHWNEHECAIWRGGVWRQEVYMGHVGWWWIVGGQRYFYERPVYPYPVVVAEIVYELPVEPVVVQQPVIIREPAPRFQPQTTQYWYWCDNPRGYSPYITSCPSGWHQVPASPPPPPQEPPEQMASPPPRESPAQAAPPSTAENIFIYPRKGQSQELQAKDRYECHSWAVSQSQYNPDQPHGGMPEAQLNQMRVDYQRAMGACLDGRGYTVK